MVTLMSPPVHVAVRPSLTAGQIAGVCCRPPPLMTPPVCFAACPSLTVGQIAGCGIVCAVMAGTLLRPPAQRSPVGHSITNWQSKSTRRPHSMVSISQRHPVKMPAYAGLRAVHTPSVTPVLGFTFTAASHVSSRGKKHARFITRAMFNDFTEKALDVIMPAQEETRRIGQHTVGILREQKQILVGLVVEAIGIVLVGQILNEVFRRIGGAIDGQTVSACVGGGNSETKMPTLEEYGTNLTKLAEEGKLDPVIGREKQIDRVIQILGRRTKNNPCLMGEPGVGKTAIAEGLAQLIATGDVPETIEGKTVIALDMALLLAGTKYRGEFKERLKNLMEEIKGSGEVILFIDEVHTVVAAGAAEGAIDAANILKPSLARGELQCIGATTMDEYRKYIEKDPALERRFQTVKVPEPTVDEIIGILKGLQQRYGIHHKVQYSDEALIAAAKLSDQYISDRFLPDKAIDLIDEAGSCVRLRHAQEAKDLKTELEQIRKQKKDAVRCQNFKEARELHSRELELKSRSKGKSNPEVESGMSARPMVTAEDIQQVVFCLTGVPVQKVSVHESGGLLKMEETLHRRIIGQDEAVTAISRAIRRARVGLRDPDRPIASFIFAGPTGVGKSELAKAVADCYYCSEKAMVRLDMSEFMERHTVAKLIGSPPGYVGYTEGGQLTEAVRRQPYTVVLLDEIDKAHPDVFKLMLQIMEDGRLTDSKGRTVDFKNTLIIMTSNVGTIKSYFPPEFLNRLDEIIVFQQLTKLEVKEIAGIMLKEVAGRMREKGIELQVTERLKDLVVEEGYDPSYGARPLRRAIMKLLEGTLTNKMLAGEVKEGDSLIVDTDLAGNVVIGHSRHGGMPELQLPMPVA